MLNEMVRDYQFVKVYGKVEFTLPKAAALTATDIQGLGTGDLNLVSVVGVKVLGQCIKYTQPVLLLLPGPGSKATDCNWDEVPDIMEWSLPKGATIVGMTPTVGEAAELLSAPPLAEIFAECISVTIKDGKACLKIPVAGEVCINVPEWVPNGTVAEVCVDICKKWGIPCGVKAHIKVAGNTVAEQKFGCC